MKQSEQIRYLLGLCSPAEREQIEAEYFSDADAFQKMLAAEDDLIDAYARGELTSEERRRFEMHFLESSRGRDRVQFAQAFAGSVSATRPGEAVRLAPMVAALKTWSSTSRIALIAIVIVLVVVLSWLVLDRRRLNTELSDQRPRAAELKAELQDLRAQPAQSEKPKERENSPSNKRRASRLSVAKRIKNVPAETTTNTPPPEVKLQREAVSEFRVTTTSISKKAENVPEETVALRAGSDEVPANRSEAAPDDRFVSKKITDLPLEASNVPSLLTLQPGTTRGGTVASSREDQANITLDGVDANAAAIKGVNINESPETPADPFCLSQLFRIANRPTTLHVPNTTTWIRFKLDLPKFAQHTDYRVTLKTVDGAEIESVDWVEPLTPNQYLIETPIIRTALLVSGDYNLLLLGKEPNGVFVRLGLYPFKLIKD